MKKYLFGLAFFALISSSLIFSDLSRAQSQGIRGLPGQANDRTQEKASSPEVSANIVISQVYGGGGNSGAPYTHDFVELFNRGATAVSINGWSTQYASATGSEFLVTPLSNITLQPGQYYLIQYASNGVVGSPLPTPDLIAPPVTNNAGNTFIPNLSGTTGKLALVNSTVRLPASNCPVDSSIVDFLGYGDNTTCSEGTKTPNFTNSTAGKRNGGGCTDTDNNLSDFTITAPAPRNTSSPTNGCNLEGILQAGISANPNTVNPSGTTLITVSVIPATVPPSTGVQVVGDLSQIGGSSLQTFFDNGTNGDVTPGDNVFSFLATIPVTAVGGVYNVTAVASDAEMRSVNLNTNITVYVPNPDENPLVLGNPSNATNDILNPNNYLMTKPQYSLSYNRSKATPNWTAWRLDSSWIGTTPRQDDFRPDTTLPAGWYQVQPFDYSEPVYDRGHMCPSGDRTNSVPNNSATFLMTNMVPQHPDNNQGPWEEFETYCRLVVAGGGKEIYIFSGPFGQDMTANNNTGVIGNGVVVPASTWKVVVIIDSGTDDVHRVNSRTTRAFGIIISNIPPIDRNAPWRNFRVTVDQVEALTGYDFMSNVPRKIQNRLEAKVDTQ